MKYGAPRAPLPVEVIHFFKTSYPNKNIRGMNSSFTEFLYDCGVIYCRCLKKKKKERKGFTQAKADGLMYRKQTCWLVLPAAAGVTWQTSEQVLKWQVCWGQPTMYPQGPVTPSACGLTGCLSALQVMSEEKEE